ncbi:hypothetical protein PAHAL_1G129700 [Panicum hallii]|uniref:Uncharacterized protein n=1 Tax=Panicum hallii TaxID=206008 RepID=A0A2S3GNS0_9POAL|nr:hypothetical protein PAHAL_1G129700 [Panicum hallii]
MCGEQRWRVPLCLESGTCELYRGEQFMRSTLSHWMLHTLSAFDCSFEGQAQVEGWG